MKIEITADEPGYPEDQRTHSRSLLDRGVGEVTGLVLDTLRRILACRDRGDMRVDSKPGETRFSVRLPIRVQERDGG